MNQTGSEVFMGSDQSRDNIHRVDPQSKGEGSPGSLGTQCSPGVATQGSIVGCGVCLGLSEAMEVDSATVPTGALPLADL